MLFFGDDNCSSNLISFQATNCPSLGHEKDLWCFQSQNDAMNVVVAAVAVAIAMMRDDDVAAVAPAAEPVTLRFE